jgi:hypothetical protein
VSHPKRQPKATQGDTLHCSDDAEATHFLLRWVEHGGATQYVGAARAIKISSSPIVYDVSRLSILKSARARGAGATFARLLEQWVWDQGGVRVTGEAREGFEAFYAKYMMRFVAVVSNQPCFSDLGFIPPAITTSDRVVCVISGCTRMPPYLRSYSALRLHMG